MTLQDLVRVDTTGDGIHLKGIDKHRVCKCGKTLSRYNKSDICYSCQEREQAKKVTANDVKLEPLRRRIRSSVQLFGKPCPKRTWKKVNALKGLRRTDRNKIKVLISEGKSNKDIAAHGFEMRHIEAVRGMNG
jgi:hypothetical protein